MDTLKLLKKQKKAFQKLRLSGGLEEGNYEYDRSITITRNSKSIKVWFDWVNWHVTTKTTWHMYLFENEEDAANFIDKELE